MPLVEEPMPFRREPTAPKLDDDSTKEQRQEIPRYFDDLEQLFNARPSLTELDKKKFAVFYLKAPLQAVWTSFPEFSDTSKTYFDFRTTVLRLYPDADPANLYTFADLNRLAANRYHLGISTLEDLADYTRKFRTISSALIRRGFATNISSRRTYSQAFQSSFLAKIAHQLEIRHPERAPDAVHPIDDVHDAAAWIINLNSHSLALFGPAHSSLAAPAVVPVVSPSPLASNSPSTSPLTPTLLQPAAPPKHEDFIDVAEKLADSIANSIQEKISEVLEPKHCPSIRPQPTASPSNDFKRPSIDPSPTLMLNTVPNPAPRLASPLHRPPIPSVSPSFVQRLNELNPSERQRACANRIQEIEDEIAALRNGLKMSQPTPESILRRSRETTASRNNSASYTTIYDDQKSLRPPVSTTDKSERAPRSPAPNFMCNIHPHASHRGNVAPPVVSRKNMHIPSFYHAVTATYTPRSLDAIEIVPGLRINPTVSNIESSPSLSTPDHASAPEHRRRCSSTSEICYQPRDMFILGPGACDAPPPSFHRATDTASTIQIVSAIPLLEEQTGPSQAIETLSPSPTVCSNELQLAEDVEIAPPPYSLASDSPTTSPSIPDLQNNLPASNYRSTSKKTRPRHSDNNSSFQDFKSPPVTSFRTLFASPGLPTSTSTSSIKRIARMWCIFVFCGVLAYFGLLAQSGLQDFFSVLSTTSPSLSTLFGYRLLAPASLSPSGVISSTSIFKNMSFYSPTSSSLASTSFTVDKSSSTSFPPSLIVSSMISARDSSSVSFISFFSFLSPSDTRDNPPTSSSSSLAISIPLGARVSPPAPTTLFLVDSTSPLPQLSSPTSSTTPCIVSTPKDPRFFVPGSPTPLIIEFLSLFVKDPSLLSSTSLFTVVTLFIAVKSSPASYNSFSNRPHAYCCPEHIPNLVYIYSDLVFLFTAPFYRTIDPAFHFDIQHSLSCHSDTSAADDLYNRHLDIPAAPDISSECHTHDFGD